MYQLLLKQRFKFAVRMIKRNIGAYLILIAIVPCILILQSMIQKNYGMDIAVFIPYGILCFLFMNLFGTIPRMRISPETYIWKIEKTYIWRVKKIGKSTVLTLCVALILFWAFPMEGISGYYEYMYAGSSNDLFFLWKCICYQYIIDHLRIIFYFISLF